MSSTPVDFYHITYQETLNQQQFTLSVLNCSGSAVATYTIPSAATDHALSLSVVRDSGSPANHILLIDDTAPVPQWQEIEVNLVTGTLNRVVFMRDHDRKDFNLMFLGTEDLRPSCTLKLPCYHLISLYLAEVRLFTRGSKLYVARNPSSPNAEESYARLLTKTICPVNSPMSVSPAPVQEHSYPVSYNL